MARGQCSLEGCRVLLLRTPDQSREIQDRLEKLGAEVLLCPMIEIIPCEEGLRKLDASFLKPFDTVLFTSANGVHLFIQALVEKGLDIASLSLKQILAVGPKTTEACNQCGLKVSGMPRHYSAAHLLDVMEENLTGRHILIPTAAGARQTLPDELKKRGAAVNVLTLYSTKFPSHRHNVTIQDGDAVFFTSSSTADHFFQCGIYKGQHIAAYCIGALTADTVKKHFKGALFIASEATGKGLVDCLVLTKNGCKNLS